MPQGYFLGNIGFVIWSAIVECFYNKFVVFWFIVHTDLLLLFTRTLLLLNYYYFFIIFTSLLYTLLIYILYLYYTYPPKFLYSLVSPELILLHVSAMSSMQLACLTKLLNEKNGKQSSISGFQWRNTAQPFRKIHTQDARIDISLVKIIWTLW